VTLVGQSVEQMEPLAQALRDEGFDAEADAVDLTDADDVTRLITGIGERHGRIDVLHFNPSAFREKDPLELSPDELLTDVRLGVGALLDAVQAARPHMQAGGRVTATGSMAADRPWNRAASLGVQKAALRNLMFSLDTTLKPDGIRAMSLTVNGTLGAGTPFDVEHVAEALFAASTRDDADWSTEVPFDGA